MDYFDKSYHQPGTPPGTLVDHEPTGAEGLHIRLLDYADGDCTDLELGDIAECRPFLAKPSITWIHLQGRPTPEVIGVLGEMFKLHPLALEDVLNTGQRPKLETYDDQLFIIMSMPDVAESRIRIRQVSLFFGENYVVSCCTGAEDPFATLRHRLRKKVGHGGQRPGADYILYGILDLVIDHGFPTLERLGEHIEYLEDKLLESAAGRETLGEIHHLRRELLLLRRNLWPQREILNTLARPDHGPIRSETRLYFRDCYDHVIQIMDLIENYRETATGLLDVYLSAASHHLNQIMRVLTIIATIFIPLTFIVGLYGMNFANPDSPWAMPELRWYYGYPLVLGLMILVSVGMITFFKRNKWL